MSAWEQIAVPDALLDTRVGKQHQVLAQNIAPAGEFPVVDQGQSFIAGYCDDASRVIDFDLPLVIFGDHTRTFKYIDFPFVLGADGTKVLKPDPEQFDAKYFYFAMLALDIPSLGYSRHFTILRERSIAKPTLPEQQRIAQVLSKVQQAIEQQERLTRTTTELKQALMQKLFTEGLRGESLKETVIGMLPESWKIVRVGDVTTIKSSSMAYSELEGSSSTEDGVLVMGVKVSDMNRAGNEQEFVAANLQRNLPPATASRKAVPAGTVVFPKRGAAIATNKKRIATCPTVLDPNLIGVAPTEIVNSRYLYHWFDTFDLRKITDPGPTPQLNKKDIAPLSMPLPSMAEQMELALAIDTIDKKLSSIAAKRNKLQDLFRTLLHELMTGKVRVNDLN
jgi:type I restriction enzyme S subunit